MIQSERVSEPVAVRRCSKESAAHSSKKSKAEGMMMWRICFSSARHTPRRHVMEALLLCFLRVIDNCKSLEMA
jgi:hypothetical protein